MDRNFGSQRPRYLPVRLLTNYRIDACRDKHLGAKVDCLRGLSEKLTTMRYSGKIEYAQERKIRERNTRLYRVLHLPIWIWVFFLAPGPLTFSLFAHGFTWGNGAWLAAVLVGTAIAGWSRPATGRGAAALHPPLRRGQAESALPQGLLHLCVECCDQLCAAQCVRPGDCRLYRRVADEGDLHLRLFAAVRADSAAGPNGQAASGWAFDQEAKARSAATSTAPSGRSRLRRRCCWWSGRPCRTTLVPRRKAA